MDIDILELIKKRIIYQIPGMEHVTVKKDIIYQTEGETSRKCDVYYPPEFTGQQKLPAVVFMNGDLPPGMIDPKLFDNAKDWAGSVSTAELVAASGLIAIPFNHRSAEDKVSKMDEVAGDLHDVLGYIQTHAEELMIDKNAIAVWAWSDGVPYLRSLLNPTPDYLRCLVIYYGAMDLQPFIPNFPPTTPNYEKLVNTIIAYSLINALKDNPKNIPPILIAKAMLDNPFTNGSIDQFVSEAQTCGASVELLTHPNGQHGFDVIDDVEKSREIIQQTLDFLKNHLSKS